ncbi:MAG TPA: penicillin-binding protein 2, partial [Piscirickettsiaceae bacterium]|nr:penicillin-binding protein 2 [Piscirickettsiaceae bacterium]
MKLSRLKALLRREHWVLASVLIVVALVLARAWFVQVEQADFLQQQAQVRQVRLLELPASRGVIYDRHGQVLALSTPVADVWLDPKQACPQIDALRPAVEVLQRNWMALRKRVLGRCDSRFMYLQRQVIPDVAQRIQAMKIPGLYVTPTYKRYYPQAEVAAHLLGFTNIDDVGQAGLEKVFDHWLRGTPGQIRVIKDLRGQVVDFYDTVRPLKPGQDMVLALDERIQYFTYRALKRAMIQHQARAAAAIVLDARTGEILALASQPGYNPNDRSQIVPQRTRNHAVSDLIEPGSTIKPFVMAKALDVGVVAADEQIDTSPGVLKVGDRLVRDDTDKGVLTLTGIIKRSSNVGISKIALRMQPQQMWSLFHQLGL